MLLDHARELHVGLKPLPLERVAPAIEETPGPALGLVVPELAKGLFQKVGYVEPLVYHKQFSQRPASFQGEVLSVRKQRVTLALDERSVFAREAAVLASPHLV